MYDSQKVYFRLNLHPVTTLSPSGKKIVEKAMQEKGPKRFFFHKDLYTTNPLGLENDEIEKYLFGKIDTTGAKALSALISPNWVKELHPYFRHVFEYMDAQKLRTPKGLSWIEQVLKCRSQIELMVAMQSIRKMNCTTWCEGVLEIVSAHDSSIKFIVSDNPVTSYNPECYPGSKYCKFPHDPSILLKGTRTIFPVDLNNCFILTNLEYAEKQGKNRALENRTNPRYFDNTLVRYDKIIRTRKLSDNMVDQINYIIKKRAHNYIAAADQDWLYPERRLKNSDWRSFNKVLLPPQKELFGFGGEIFVGGKDGELIMTQDAFGRKPKNKKKWEQKEKEIKRANEMFQNALKKLKNSVS